jgi:hypothetical protein
VPTRISTAVDAVGLRRIATQIATEEPRPSPEEPSRRRAVGSLLSAVSPFPNRSPRGRWAGRGQRMASTLDAGGCFADYGQAGAQEAGIGQVPFARDRAAFPGRPHKPDGAAARGPRVKSTAAP